MDLWDVTSNFLVSNVTGKNFRITDILALGNSLKIQLKPPRNANSSQVTFLVRDLLDVARQQCQVWDFVSKVAQVKPFEVLGLTLKDHLMSESILCMNGTLRTVYDQQKEIARLKQLVETNRMSASLDGGSIKDLSNIDYPASPSSRPEHSSRTTSRSNGTLKRSSSYARPPSGADLERLKTPDDEVAMRSMVKQMNAQLSEQRKSVAKISKLCLGALTSIEQLESRVGSEGSSQDLTRNQPMERIKKLTEDMAKMNNYLHELDTHLDGVERKMKDEIQKTLPLNKMMARLEQDVNDTKINVMEEMRNLREDMKSFASEVTQDSQSNGNKLKELDKFVSAKLKTNSDDHIKTLENKIESIKLESAEIGNDLVHLKHGLHKSSTEEKQKSKTLEAAFEKVKGEVSTQATSMQGSLESLEKNFQSKLDAEMQTMKENQSQAFKNLNLKYNNEIASMKSVTEKQDLRISHLESVIDSLSGKMSDFNSKAVVDQSSMKNIYGQVEDLKSESKIEIEGLKKDVANILEELQRSDKIATEVKNCNDEIAQVHHEIAVINKQVTSKARHEKDLKALETFLGSVIEEKTKDKVDYKKVKALESSLESSKSSLSQLNQQITEHKNEREVAVKDLWSKLESVTVSTKDIKVDLATEVKRLDTDLGKLKVLNEVNVNSKLEGLEARLEKTANDLVSKSEEKIQKNIKDQELKNKKGLDILQADLIKNLRDSNTSIEAKLESKCKSLSDKAQELVDEALKSVSIRFNESSKAAENSLGNTEARFESQVKDMKNSILASQNDIQASVAKQVLDVKEKFESKLASSEKSTEANLESKLRKLKNESNYATQNDMESLRNMLKETKKEVLDKMTKNYDAVKVETVKAAEANLESRILKVKDEMNVSGQKDMNSMVKSQLKDLEKGMLDKVSKDQDKLKNELMKTNDVNLESKLKSLKNESDKEFEGLKSAIKSSKDELVKMNQEINKSFEINLESKLKKFKEDLDPITKKEFNQIKESQDKSRQETLKSTEVNLESKLKKIKEEIMDSISKQKQESSKSFEVNVESKLKKLKEEFIEVQTKQKQESSKSSEVNLESKLKAIKEDSRKETESLKKELFDHVKKKYDVFKSETIKDCGSELGRKLGTEVQMAKQDLLSHIDSKVNELGRFHDKIRADLSDKAAKDEMLNLNVEVKALAQNWSLVKAIESELTKMQDKLKNDEISREQLTQLVSELKSNDKVNSSADDLTKDILELQKSMKEAKLDRKFELEAIQKEIKASRPTHDIHKLQLEQSRIVQQLEKLENWHEKLQNTEAHLDLVHGELAKSIHIIDKHSVEIDEVAMKVKGLDNLRHCQDLVKDLSDNLKTVQLHIANFRDNFNKLNPLTSQVENLEQLMKRLNDSTPIKVTSLRGKSVTPPSPRPRDKSPGVFRNEIDELKNFLSETQTSHKRLKKTVETFKKKNEADVSDLQNGIEQSSEKLENKIASLESQHQDNIAQLKHLKMSLRNVITEELKNCKQFTDMEMKLYNIKELLLRHDETFREILENLSMNQLAINALKEFLTSDDPSRSL